eukprot:jgi/Hompol1/3391/HPOL_006538-RA
MNYRPQMSDEMQLNIGDQVILESIWSDGWAQGYNLTTRERGTLAIAVLDSAPKLTPETGQRPIGYH